MLKIKKNLYAVLNKRQNIRCEKQNEAIQLIRYLEKIGYYAETYGGIVELPWNGEWDRYRDKTVICIEPGIMYGRIAITSVDKIPAAESVINFSALDL